MCRMASTCSPEHGGHDDDAGCLPEIDGVLLGTTSFGPITRVEHAQVCLHSVLLQNILWVPCTTVATSAGPTIPSCLFHDEHNSTQASRRGDTTDTNPPDTKVVAMDSPMPTVVGMHFLAVFQSRVRKGRV